MSERLVPIAPQDLEAEEYVLSAVMYSQAALDDCTEILQPGDFYRHSHGAIWRAALHLQTAGVAVDPVTVRDRLRQTDDFDDQAEQHLTDIARLTPIIGGAPHHARIVREMAELRALISFGHDTARLGLERPASSQEMIEDVQQRAYDLGQTRDGNRTVPIDGPLQATFARMTELAESGQQIIGTPSGYRDLDRITSGLEPGNLIVVAARPGMGKSSLGLAVASNVAIRQNTPVAIFSFEMGPQILAQRLLAREAHVDLGKIRAPGRGLQQDEWARLARAADNLQKAPIYINERDNTIAEVRSQIRRLKTKQPTLGLIVVDYLQLMNAKAENRTQEITKISGGLKQIAGEYDVPILAVSQLNRAVELRQDKHPQLADLRESGAIEQDADIVAFLFRDGYYNDKSDTPNATDLTISKNRNGELGVVKLHWDGPHATFGEVAHV